MKEVKHLQAYGTWVVTTEGDCEGRTTRHLGTHTGYIDDIAFALADRAYYGLRFDAVDPLELKDVPPKGTRVQVSLDIGTGTWDLDGKQRVKYFQQMLHGRQVLVGEGQYYACVELINGSSPEAEAANKRRVLAGRAREKLSADELSALLGESK